MWKVGLSGDSYTLAELSKICTDAELKVTKDDEGYFLTASLLGTDSEKDEVWDKANELVARLSGAANLMLGGKNSVSVSNLRKIDENEFEKIYLDFHETINVRVSIDTDVFDTNGIRKKIEHSSKLLSVINMSLDDPSVAKVLRLSSNSYHDWADLYRIYEVIKYDMSPETDVVDEGWVSKKELNNFTHTANSPDAIGDLSRHGAGNSKPPPVPMTHYGAQELVSRIIRNWIGLKSAIE